MPRVPWKMFSMSWQEMLNVKTINMKQLITFIRKEFLHVFARRKPLLIFLGLPIAQIVLFGFALSNEIKDSKIVVADYSKDAVTRQIINKIAASKYFDLEQSLQSADQLQAAFKKGTIKMAVLLPQNFATDLIHTNKATIQVIAHPSDPNLPTTITHYIITIILDYNAE